MLNLKMNWFCKTKNTNSIKPFIQLHPISIILIEKKFFSKTAQPLQNIKRLTIKKQPVFNLTFEALYFFQSINP